MTLLRFVKNLPVDGYLLSLIATVALAALFPARGVAAQGLDTAVYAAVAGLFFLYGARLSPSSVWQGIGHWRLQGLVLLTTFVVFPLIGLAVTRISAIYLAPDLVTGLLFLCVLPSTVQSSIAFTSIAGGNVSAALCSASLSNLLGVFLTPFLVSRLFHSAANANSAQAFRDIALQILLPFLLGQAARPFIAGWLHRHKLLTMLFDRGSILLVVFSAFSAGMAAGVWTRLTPTNLIGVLLFDLLILAIVIVGTTVVSRISGFSTEDEISIVFCGSKKSMAGGIPMANILFAGHSVSLIVLPLMLFHQAQLIICATLARRYSRRK